MFSLGRILRSDLKDLKRGRVGGNWRDEVADVILPKPLHDLVVRTSGKVGLGRKFRAAFARELTLKFAEQLAAGETPEEIAARHGTPRTAARRARRAALQHMPVRRAKRLAGRISTILLCIGLLTYAYHAFLYYTGVPNIARNHGAEMDAMFASHPPGERAWPAIKRLRDNLALPQSGAFKAPNSWPHPKPGSETWNIAARMLADHPNGLNELRNAAKMPVLGYCISGGEDPEDHEDIQPAGQVNDPVIVCLLPHLGALRAQARLLCFDSRLALEQNDSDRAAADFIAALGLARFSDEHGLMIEQLVRIAIIALVVDSIRELIADHPGFLSDHQLASLAEHIQTVAGTDRYPIVLAGERRFIEDIAQRAFTDDGHGDGHICHQGMRNQQEMGSSLAPRQAIIEFVAAPMLMKTYGSRKLFSDTYDRLLAPFQERAVKPMWEWSIAQPVDDCDRIMNDPNAQRVERMAAILVPAYGKSLQSSEQVTLTRDATLVTIALERYRLKNARLPSKLDELVPEFLRSIPRDRFDGQPLRYRETDSGMVLYSIGADLKDDGGIPMRSRRGEIVRVDMNRASPVKGDWVLFPPPRDPLPDMVAPNP